MAAIPSIWFEGNAEAAMNFYVQTFPGSKIKAIERYAGDQGIPSEDEFKGKVLNGVFEVNGTTFYCLDGPSGIFERGGPVSFTVEFETQEELDKVWNRLMEGGKPQQCGWIFDKYGLTWQIIPAVLGRMMSDPKATPRQKKALLQAMLKMVKMEIEPLSEAFRNAA